MQLNHIALSQLVISRANMRARHRKDIADLIPSVRTRGVLVPLLVRPNGEPDRYEIVAGRRRFLAASVVAGEGEGDAAVPCAIMEPGDDAAALEASLIENVARLDADDVTRWETFARLVKKGRGVDDIAATFGLAERVVRRILALGNLLPRIRSLYRSEKIDPATVRHLTLASHAQQRAWLALLDSADAYAPTGRALKDWLFGGSAIATSVARFDLATYAAPIVADLFDEHSYFSDTALFWSLQGKAIEGIRAAYREQGWNDVRVLDIGHAFERWSHEKRPRAKGGRVYIEVATNGAVEVHEGYIPRREAEREKRTQNPTPAPPRPELTAPLRRYVDLHRHAVVKATLLDRPQVALRAMLAHAIIGSPLWSVKREEQRADKPETEQSVMTSLAQAVFDKARTLALLRLGTDPDRTALVGGRYGQSFTALFGTLMALADEEVLELVTIAMGETLAAGGEAVEAIGRSLAPDPAAFWHADEAFWTLLRDRPVIGALLEEVAGPEVARANADAPAKVQKAILRDCLDGSNGRTKVEGWVPRWLRLPAATYRTGEAHVTDASPDGDQDAAEQQDTDDNDPAG